MAWNSADEKELGMFIAKNSLREASHLPFMVAYDRFNPLVMVYVHCRVPQDQSHVVHEQLWKHAWFKAAEFAKAEMTYREWLMAVADDLIGSMLLRSHAKDNNPSKQPQSFSWIRFLDQQKKGALFSAVGSLSQDHHNVLRAKALGFTNQEIQAAFKIDQERIEKWFKTATTQVEKAIGVNEKLVVSSTPQEDSALGQWIQETTASATMKQWVAELWAMQQIETTQSVDSRLDFIKWLEGKQDSLAQDGLNAISRKDLQRLLQRPWLLFELQRFLLIHQNEDRLHEVIDGPQASQGELQRTHVALILGPHAVCLNRNTGNLQSASWWKKRNVTIAVIAILVGSIITGVLIQKRHVGSTKEWNWQDDVPHQAMNSSQEYLNLLAMSAEGWFSERSSDSTILLQQLSTIKSNLQYLKTVALPRLKPVDQVWLNEQLKNWNSKRDELESKVSIDPETTRKEADELVTEIISSLYQRAASRSNS